MAGRPEGTGIARYRHPLSKVYNRFRRASFRCSWGQGSRTETWQFVRDEIPAEYWEFVHSAYIRGVLHGLEASIAVSEG